ncbi:MAG: hypothetical protein AAGC74_12745 [Verrucomicrobiota bacterium]
MGESDRHRELKRAALHWAQTAGGYRFAGVEVRVPRSRYRADVVSCGNVRSFSEGAGLPTGGTVDLGARDGSERDRRAEAGDDGGSGRSALFECKQARGDFLTDSGEEAASLEQLEGLHERRRSLERQLGVHYPHLRKGEMLFPEFDGIYGEELPHEGYGKLIREIAKLESRVFRRTKFEKLLRWRSAHALYLVTWPGVVRGEHEIPTGWGWLEAEGFEGADRGVRGGTGEGEEAEAGEDAFEKDTAVGGVVTLVLRRKPMRLLCSVGTELLWLERLAAGGTRRVNVEMGVSDVWRGGA